jgi:hypothetical protein
MTRPHLDWHETGFAGVWAGQRQPRPRRVRRTTEGHLARLGHHRFLPPYWTATRPQRSRRGLYPLPLSFRKCVPFREIRLCDVDGVSDLFSVPGASFSCGPSGGPLPSGAVARKGDDRAGQPAERVTGPVAAVPALHVGGDVGADEAADGGERDEPGIGPGPGGSAGSSGGRDVVDEQQRPGFLPREFRGLAAQRPARAADGFPQVQGTRFPPAIFRHTGPRSRGQDRPRGPAGWSAPGSAWSLTGRCGSPR